MKVVTVAVVVCALAALTLAEQRRHYCGRRLDKKMYEVCRGFYNKRSGSVNIDLSDAGGDDLEDILFAHALKSGGGVRERRGIVQECCHRGCTDLELSYYCESR